MPIQRFESFEEARRALWVERDDPALARRIRNLWAFAARLTPVSTPRGLRKFRSIEEANLDRERRTSERVRALRELRQSSFR